MSDIGMDEYQERAMSTAVYPRQTKLNMNLIVNTLRAAAALGAFSEKIGKTIRDDGGELSTGRAAELSNLLEEAQDRTGSVSGALGDAEDAVCNGDDREQLPPEVTGLAYVALKLVGEAAEVAAKVADAIWKAYDHRPFSEDDKRQLSKESGDCQWYLAALAKELGIPLSKSARENLEKLADRAARGVLGGSGDNR